MSDEKNTEFDSAQRRKPGRMQRGMMPGEKAKDFKGSFGKLFSYLGSYRAAIVLVMVLAACSTVFSVLGPKIMGKATTSLSEGLMNKIAGTGGIDFNYIAKILLITLGLYLISSVLSFCQGMIMTGITQKICYRMRKEISEKINQMCIRDRDETDQKNYKYSIKSSFYGSGCDFCTVWMDFSDIISF